MEELKKFQELYKGGIIKKRGVYMSDMERTFKIPMFNNEEYNNKNKEVIELYRKFAAWPLEG